MTTHNGKRPAIVVRTERGLSIAGTRITLAGVMDYVTEGWPPKLIRDWLNLTDEQIDGVMHYIATHRAEVEEEYRQVLADAEEERQYWETRNQEQAARLATLPPGSDNPEARAKLAAAKAKRQQA
jgi:phage terminase Nu1 subunit (DNA packaging protein)